MRTSLFPSDISDADLAHFTAAASDWPGAPIENCAVETADWQTLQGWRNELRGLRGELSETNNLSARDQAALKVAARVLQSINGELDARTELGNREPRAHVGRQTDGSASDNPRRPLRVSDDVGPSKRSMAAVYAKPNAAGLNGFASFGAFALAAVRDPTDPRLRAAVSTYQREGVGQDGGFAVAPQWVDQLLDAALEQEVVRPRANVIPVSSNPVVFPAFDLSSNADAKRAGVQLKWMGEAASGTDQAAKLRDVTLAMHKGAIFISLSSEIFEDMPNAERRISNIMSAAVAAGVDYAFLNGTGVAQPTGILNSPALIAVSKVGSQTATTLNLQNLVAMVGRLHPRSYANATWLVHPTCIASLLQLTVTIANRGNTENVGGSFAPAVVYGPDGSMRIFGRPVVVTDACSVLGTAGDVILADLSRYLIAVRREATLQTSIHANWQQDLYAMRLILRLNGCTEDNAPTTLRDGSNTVSPFVVVETRS